MIKVHRINNGLGNKMFEYALGRILAVQLGFRLEAKPIQGFSNTNKLVDGKAYRKEDGYPLEVIRGHDHDIYQTLQDKSPREIQVCWPVQRYDYYKGHVVQIKKWFKIERATFKPEIEDVVIHIRRGDYLQHAVKSDKRGYPLPYDFYRKILSQIKYRKIYIVTDDPHDNFLGNFKGYNAKILSSFQNPKGGWQEQKKGNNEKYLISQIEDFKIIKEFKRIILSASSFSWWAAFLSDAKEVYFPIPKKGYWSDNRPDIELRVPEKRYIYVDE
jgi:hypothetical protein